MAWLVASQILTGRQGDTRYSTSSRPTIVARKRGRLRGHPQHPKKLNKFPGHQEDGVWYLEALISAITEAGQGFRGFTPRNILQGSRCHPELSVAMTLQYHSGP